MKSWIVLLRSINVGGKNVVKMADLRTKLTNEGFENVQTYIQSGNLVLRTRLRKATSIAERIEKSLAEHFQVHTTAIAMDEPALQEIAANNPYPEAEDNPKSVHLCFLDERPREPNWERLDELQKPSEQYKLIGSTFYFLAPEGVGRSRLFAAIDRSLGVASTARNWRTIQKLLAMTDE